MSLDFDSWRIYLRPESESSPNHAPLFLVLFRFRICDSIGLCLASASLMQARTMNSIPSGFAAFFFRALLQILQMSQRRSKKSLIPGQRLQCPVLL